jgi:hypothetical protein
MGVCATQLCRWPQPWQRTVVRQLIAGPASGGHTVGVIVDGVRLGGKSTATIPKTISSSQALGGQACCWSRGVQCLHRATDLQSIRQFLRVLIPARPRVSQPRPFQSNSPILGYYVTIEAYRTAKDDEYTVLLSMGR